MKLSEAVTPARTGIPNRRLGDVVVLALVTGGLIEFCVDVLGVRDNLSLVVLAIACASQAVQSPLDAHRSDDARGARRAIQIRGLVAIAPWIVLTMLQSMHPLWWIWQPAAVPPAWRVAGCALALGLVLARPFLGRDDGGGDAGSGGSPAAVPSQLLMLSVLLVSRSLLVAGLIAYWFAAAALQRFPVGHMAPSSRVVPIA